MPLSSYPTPTNAARRWWLLPLGLLLIACCFWSGLIYYIPFVPAILSNRLDRVEGKAEVVMPAQWRPNIVRMSPDGQRAIVQWQKDGTKQWILWNITNDQQVPLHHSISTLRWLSNDYVAILGCCDDYYVVNAQTGAISTTIKLAQDARQQLTNFEQLEQKWRRAKQVYVLYTFSMGGYTVFTFGDKGTKVYRAIGRTNAEAEKFIARIPHIDVPEYARPIPKRTNDTVPSPDGRWFVTWQSYDSTSRVAIYTRDGQLVASAWKGGWEPFFAGWASDSSGVYFQMAASGEAAHMLVSYAPLFKLSPLTPEQQRWQTLTTGAWWAGGLAAAGGAAWWLRRRRRRRAGDTMTR